MKVFLLTPPFTQLNTAYPATAYLKGFLNTLSYPSHQCDLGLEVILDLFCAKSWKKLFDLAEKEKDQCSENSRRILALRRQYEQTIDPVIQFLQHKDPTLAHSICSGNYLPEASRFDQVADFEWAFGAMGIQDKARHLATLYLEDVSDLIIETIDPHFGFSRYAERLGRSAYEFDELYQEINDGETFIDKITLRLLKEKLEKEAPELVVISVPFPGNLYSAFKCAQFIRKKYPAIKIALGGGFPNTELRSLKDARVFEFFHFVCLDDGEVPLENLLQYLQGKRALENLKRTFVCIEGKVEYINGSKQADYKQKDVGTPDYSDLLLNKYLSVIEMANPMHRLWSDGRWNKLTLAHGCYWAKCTFCDISLDYIKIYEAASAKIIVDRIEEVMQQTGQTGFHFVDEAAPPALMKEVALEILRRRLTVVWWTNIRFEKSFSADLCRLLAAAGCIAVSGGLEVASDRLLELIDKGVTVEQVARVTRNFTEADIMVHAYLMYGYPTQTEQETIDSLEMVRQLFQAGIVQSGFWHQFAMTSHSPVGMFPEKFKVKKLNESEGSFANNDLLFEDPVNCKHEDFSEGLKKSLFNYMHGVCFDFPLQEWFDFKVRSTTIPKSYIKKALKKVREEEPRSSAKVLWLHDLPQIEIIDSAHSLMTFYSPKEEWSLTLGKEFAAYLMEFLRQTSIYHQGPSKYGKLKEDFIKEAWGELWSQLNSKELIPMRKIGLLFL